MRQKFVIASFILMSLLFTLGFFMIFGSTEKGYIIGHWAMQQNGGSMDTERYYSIINSATENYRTAGTVTSLVSGFGILMSGYGLYKELS